MLSKQGNPGTTNINTQVLFSVHLAGKILIRVKPSESGLRVMVKARKALPTTAR